MDSTLTIHSGTGFLEPVQFRKGKIETSDQTSHKTPNLVNTCCTFVSEAAFICLWCIWNTVTIIYSSSFTDQILS